MIQAIAFDLDDTLWHVHPVIVRAEIRLDQWLKMQVPELQYSVRDMGQFREALLAEAPDLRHRLTEFRRRVIEASMLASDINPKNAQAHSIAAMEVFLTARNDVVFFDGALETIRSIATRYQLGALTNGNADINRLGLADHFSFAFSAEQVGAPKPSPDLFLAALSHTGLKPIEMVYVGDDPEKDIDTANGVGLHTVWLANKARPGPGETKPDRTIEDIRELPAAIASLERP